MPSALKIKAPNRRSRNISGEQRPQAKPIAVGVVSATKAGSVVTIVFNQAVGLKGVPRYTTNLAGVTAVSAVLTNPTTLAVTFSAAVTTATTLNLPVEDPAIRSASGGFVATTTFPVT